MTKLGLKSSTTTVNWAVKSWSNCIDQLDEQFDIVFFGDSITYGGDWKEAFNTHRVINFGYPGDTLQGMTDRVDMLKTVNPNYVFIMGGINGLKVFGVDKSIAMYTQLIEDIKDALPSARIIVQSCTPVTKDMEKTYGTNEEIVRFNTELMKLSEIEGVGFIDVWSLYEVDGQLDEEKTKDGIHLKTEYYKEWYDLLEKYVIGNL